MSPPPPLSAARTPHPPRPARPAHPGVGLDLYDVLECLDTSPLDSLRPSQQPVAVPEAMEPPVNSEFHSPKAFWRQILTVFRSRRYPSTCRLYQQEDTTIEDIEDLLRGVGSAGGELNVATETDAGNRISANSTDQGVTADRGSLIPLEKRREGEQDKTKGGGNDLHFRRHDDSLEMEGPGHVSLAPNAVVQPEMR